MRSFLFLVIISCISVDSSSQNALDKDAVKKVVLAFQQDFNDGGFKNANNYTTLDWEHINPMGGITNGREEVLKEVRDVHQAFLKGVTGTIDSMTIRFINTDVAIATTIERSSPFTTPDGVKHESQRSVKTYIIVKQHGKWLLTLDQNTFIGTP